MIYGIFGDGRAFVTIMRVLKPVDAVSLVFRFVHCDASGQDRSLVSLLLRSVACTLVCVSLLGCQEVSTIVLDPHTGQNVELAPCPDYARPFKRASIRWELIQAYVGIELKIAPSLVTSLRGLGEKHEAQARKLCESAFELFVFGGAEYYHCRDTFLHQSARQVEEINVVFEEVKGLKYEELKKQSERIEKLLLDYQKRFLPLEQACGPPPGKSLQDS